MKVRVSLDGGKTMRTIVKSCTCGLNFTAHEWSLLALVGTMMDPDEPIELRNCPCGSTIAVEVGPREVRGRCADCRATILVGEEYAMVAERSIVRGRIGSPSDEITGTTRPRVIYRCGGCLRTEGPLR